MMYEMKNPCSLHTIQIVKSPWSIKKKALKCVILFLSCAQKTPSSLPKNMQIPQLSPENKKAHSELK